MDVQSAMVQARLHQEMRLQCLYLSRRARDLPYSQFGPERYLLTNLTNAFDETALWRSSLVFQMLGVLQVLQNH